MAASAEMVSGFSDWYMPFRSGIQTRLADCSAVRLINVISADDYNAVSWPMYRSDGRRGAFVAGSVPGAERTLECWIRVGTEVTRDSANGCHRWRRLTLRSSPAAPLLLAELQTHQVIALDKATTGPRKWRSPRADASPSHQHSTVVGGCSAQYDGWAVYALDAADGEMV